MRKTVTKILKSNKTRHMLQGAKYTASTMVATNGYVVVIEENTGAPSDMTGSIVIKHDGTPLVGAYPNVENAVPSKDTLKGRVTVDLEKLELAAKIDKKSDVVLDTQVNELTVLSNVPDEYEPVILQNKYALWLVEYFKELNVKLVDMQYVDATTPVVFEVEIDNIKSTFVIAPLRKQ